MASTGLLLGSKRRVTPLMTHPTGVCLSSTLVCGAFRINVAPLGTIAAIHSVKWVPQILYIESEFAGMEHPG